jgi:hypothetical protein
VNRSESRMRVVCGMIVLLAVAGPSVADPGALLREIAPGVPGGNPGVSGVLWGIAADEQFASDFLAAVDERQLVLVDTLLSVLRMPEPQIRSLLPDLYVIRDFGDPPGQRPPAWADVRWAGVRWMRGILEFAGDGRDARVRAELDRALANVGRPQPAEMGGLVNILVLWWADRGLDPRLTHRSRPRDPAARALAAADRLPDLQHPAPGLELLKAMDRDPVVRERVLSRLSPDSTAWLSRDFMLCVELDADSLYALGVRRRYWDAEAQVPRGHSVRDLRELALAALDQTAPAVASGPDELSRRLARLAWWDDARFEARYWSDPQQAPDFSVFLLGLRKSESEGGRDLMRWVRLIYLQSGITKRRILDRLGEPQEPVVAELLGLGTLSREEAAAAGFRMVYTRRPISRAEGQREVAVAIDFERVRELIHQMLAAITGEGPGTVLARAPAARTEWWTDWWAARRDDPRWYRGPVPEALVVEPGPPELDLEPRRGRVD